jgi:hypothetical protein
MVMKKLERPPSAHNWVRYIYPEELKTAKAIVTFATAAPQVTYSAGMPIIRDRITLKLDRATANTAASTRGHKKSRPHVVDFVNAFFDYDEVRNYSGLPSYDQEVAAYQVSRNIRVPVKPLVVISETGFLKPIFLVGWATMPLSVHQRRLLMTILEDAVFSLTDFQNSPGEFLSFPKGDNSGVRSAEVWKRGDYELLSKREMKEQVEVYLAALDLAKRIVAGRATAEREQTAPDAATSAENLQSEMNLES